MSLDTLRAFFSEVEPKAIVEPKEDKQEGDNPILTRHIERDKQSQEIYFKMANNIKKSERLRRNINKDIKNKVSKDIILKSCLECISLMTGDSVFYSQNIKELEG